MKIKLMLPVFIMLYCVASCNSGSNIDTTAIVGVWQWDVPTIKEQMLKNGHLKNTPETNNQLDSVLRPLVAVKMEFQAKGVIIAHLDSMTVQTGTYEFIEKNKILHTEINHLPKFYAIKYLGHDKIVLLETMPMSPVRKFILYPAKP